MTKYNRMQKKHKKQQMKEVMTILKSICENEKIELDTIVEFINIHKKENPNKTHKIISKQLTSNSIDTSHLFKNK